MRYPRLVRRPHAAQQPDWPDPVQLAKVRNVLSATDALVGADQIVALRRSLERAARGEALVLQVGDCAERPGECTGRDIAAKCGLVHQLGDLLRAASGLPVVRVGRIAGQFAKPRSNPVEEIGGTVLPAYRGHLVNTPEFDVDGRRADPLRMLVCFMAAREAMQHLGWRAGDDWAERDLEDRVWTSHEALLLDYEQALVRRVGRRRQVLGSTHWPWIGERTRQADGAHVDLLSKVVNPVGCKVGPMTTPTELLELCERLDPGRQHGRLTLISRMGPSVLHDRLPALVRAVRGAGHPVLWLSDPMHANTIKRADGSKTRFVATITEEVRAFRSVMDTLGAPAHGLHLEASPYAVGECDGGSPAKRAERAKRAEGSQTLCDPRLSPEQAAEVVSAWAGARTPYVASALSSEK